MTTALKLIIFVLVVLTVFIFYRTQEQSNFLNLTVSLDVETSEKTNTFREKTQNKCPQGNMITVDSGGRFGNVIWEYISLFSAYQMYKVDYDLEAFVPLDIKTKIERVFESISLPVLEDIPLNCRVNDRKEITIGYNDFFISIDQLPKDEKIIIRLLKWSAKYEFVVPFGVDNIKKELRYRFDLQTKAELNLQSIKNRFFNDNDDVTFIGMHFRGTDMTRLVKEHLKEKFKGPPTYEYYNKAMSFFEEKYDKVIFILFTIDEDWLHKNEQFFNKNAKLLINPIKTSAGVDELVLLSNCNHSIISYGTYASTAALLAGGTTFVCDLKIPLDFEGPTLTMGLAALLPNWHKISY